VTEEDIEEIRERKREELVRRLAEEGSGNPDETVSVSAPGEFEAFVADHDVVLVDFYADWCGPCRMMEPVVERVAAETDAAVAKVDADAHGGLAAEYGVRGLPTFLVFHDGEPVERLVGGQDESRLRAALAR